MTGRGILRLICAAVAVGLLFCLAVAAGTATAATPLQFDANLSLTGSCATPDPELDPLPDPGCPNPPHPPQPFRWPKAVTVDEKGNIYVASFGNPAVPSEGRVDIFDAQGFFITEFAVSRSPSALAVDSKGTLYISTLQSPRLVSCKPSVYGPGPADIQYGNPCSTLVESSIGAPALDVNRSNDHLFASFGDEIKEWGSIDEANPSLGAAVSSPDYVSSTGTGLAIDAEAGRIYATNNGPSGGSGGVVVKAYELDPPHALVQTIDGSTVPAGRFLQFDITLAVDEATGHLFAYDGDAHSVYELSEDGTLIDQIDHGFKTNGAMDVAVDNGTASPNGALNADGRNLYVPSHPSGTGHVFAFGPATEFAPAIESLSFASVTNEEAELRANVNPGNLATDYTFKITTQAAYELEVEKFENAETVGSGSLPAVLTASAAAAGASGLSPETQYRYQLVVTNAEGEDEAEGTFTTYPSEPTFPSCSNSALRVGLSALLPDCRAYELVSPADTNARSPMGLGESIPTMNASPAGDSVSFKIEGGSFGGTDATGSLAGDPYRASRSTSGWVTSYTGPTGAEAVLVRPITVSPDQGYLFWNTGPSGTAAVGNKVTSYVRYPDGHSELVGRGSLGTEPRAGGRLISADGEHILFKTGNLAVSPAPVPKQLEPNAAPDGTPALYDRTLDGVTHVISLLPDDQPLLAGQDPTFEGASLDGTGVAFSLGGTLYLRYDNEATFEIGEGVTFAGVAEGGSRIFYLEGGRLKRFDAETGEITEFNESGTAVPVNVSADGSSAYLVSTNVLTAAPNPRGDVADAGQENLYLSRGDGEMSFIGAVTKRDVEGEVNSSETVGGLGLWTRAVGTVGGPPGRYGIDPSRSNPDGSALVFESRANLTGYDPEGRAQIYRYDADGLRLDCISCHPAGAPAAGDASLQTLRFGAFFPEPINSFGLVRNLSPDGRRAFFQTPEALVPRDTNGLQDIYEWEEQGVGSCIRANGCVYLISSPHSDRTEYIYAVSDSGDDVFFRSSDLLTPTDIDETPSIYDARVGGGFPPAETEACPIAQSCVGAIPAPPALPAPSSQATGPSGNVTKPRKKACPRGKKRVKRSGRVRCVKKKPSKKHGRKAGAENKGGKR